MQIRSELKLLFTGLLTQYPEVGKIFDSYWKEIVEAYTGPGRHYHTLYHLGYIYSRLEECPEKAGDREAILFCLFYHDLVYEIPPVENEERSAAIAAQRMKGLGVKKETIDLCVNHILSTKTHQETDNIDSNLFCDADIAILGENPERYKQYCSRLRSEFSNISDADFMNGRVRELGKLLGMKCIFKTKHFFDRYEEQARMNMQDEISRLSVIS